MNELTRKLSEQAVEETQLLMIMEYKNFESKLYEKFAELIVKECIYTLQLKIVRNGCTPENLRSYQHIGDLATKFDIKLPLDYYPNERTN